MICSSENLLRFIVRLLQVGERTLTSKRGCFRGQGQVDWFNNRRLLAPIGNIPPAEAEARYYAQASEFAMVA
ncbi:MAG: hypothetical protein CMM61_05870 [Rhodospirillaceae bacterium]|nr:hypothetical protein [Rhodospirillaceae bacterium]